MSDVEVSEHTEDTEDTYEDTFEEGDGFLIKVNGETVHEVDIDPRLVVSISLRSAQGEAGIAGSPFSGAGHNWVNLALVVQQPSALPVVEDDMRLASQEEGVNEVLTYNEIAVRAEEEVELNAEGGAADTSGEMPETGEEDEEVSESDNDVQVKPMA